MLPVSQEIEYHHSIERPVLPKKGKIRLPAPAHLHLNAELELG